VQSDKRQNADCTFFTTLPTSNRFSLTAIESPSQSGVADDLIELVFVSDDVKKAKKVLEQNGLRTGLHSE
jgi:hypothetical protein